MAFSKDWNNDANLAAWRESYPTGSASFGAEYNDVGGGNPTSTAPLPDDWINDSLAEVRKEGKIKEASKSSSIRKVLVGSGAALVTAATLITSINSGKPSVNDFSSSYEGETITYSFMLSYSKEGDIRMRIRQNLVDSILVDDKYMWSQGTPNGSLRELQYQGTFDVSFLAKGKFKFLIDSNIGYGYTNVFDSSYEKI